MAIKYSYQVTITSPNGELRNLYLIVDQKKSGKFFDKVRTVNKISQVTFKYQDPLISISCWDYDSMICIIQQSLFPIKTYQTFKNSFQNIEISILLSIDIDDQSTKQNNQCYQLIKQKSIKSEVGDRSQLGKGDNYFNFEKMKNYQNVDKYNQNYETKLKQVKSWSNLHQYQVGY